MLNIAGHDGSTHVSLYGRGYQAEDLDTRRAYVCRCRPPRTLRGRHLSLILPLRSLRLHITSILKLMKRGGSPTGAHQWRRLPGNLLNLLRCWLRPGRKPDATRLSEETHLDWLLLLARLKRCERQCPAAEFRRSEEKTLGSFCSARSSRFPPSTRRKKKEVGVMKFW